MLERCRPIEHIIHVSDLCHVPFGQVLVEGFRTSEYAMHVGDAGHVPLPDRAVDTLGAIANCRQFEALVDSRFEILFVPRCKHCGRGEVSVDGVYVSE